jgi:NitT/TauT family transport system substrate-binding protein
MRRLVRFLWASFAVLAALPAAAESRTVLIVGGIEKQIYLPAILAERLGYFREQGLDVELQSELSGVSAADALLSGAAQGVVGAYDHTIDLQARGKSVQSVVQFSIAPGEVELASTAPARPIQTPADLRGRRLGVTGLGSSTSFLTQYIAALHGVKGADLLLVPVGSGDAFIAAMEQGRIDAGMTTEPTASRLVSSGRAVVLVDLRTPDATNRALGGLYPFACLYMQTSWINGHRDQVQKLANALVRALRYISTHSAAEIAAQLPPAHFAGNRPLYVQSLAASKSMFTPDGVMPASGPESVLKILSAVNKGVRAKGIDLGKTYTTEFVSLVPGR